ncbi:hypothetical protein J4214_01335 [Candidatus Woesearchaeota archaeon]|nr:hypothetical protein [Candidatus Woesearchaeota archaeon]
MERKKLKREASINDNIKSRISRKKRVIPVESNKFVIILIIVGIFAVLVIIAQLPQKQQAGISSTSTTITSRPLTCEEKCNKNQECIDNCKIFDVNRITTKGNADFTECSSLKDKNSEKICINSLAMKLSSEKLDPSYCDAIDDTVKRENCRINVIFDRAIKNKDKLICEQILNENTKELCKKSII